MASSPRRMLFALLLASALFTLGLGVFATSQIQTGHTEVGQGVRVQYPMQYFWVVGASMISLSLVIGIHLFEEEAMRSKLIPHLVLFLLVLPLIFFGFTVRLGFGASESSGEIESAESWLYYGFLGPVSSGPGQYDVSEPYSQYFLPFYVVLFFNSLGIAVTVLYLVRPHKARRLMHRRTEKPDRRELGGY
ncbi:MAG: hypothetical protein ACE5IB_01295 [Candidatus Geothermarchaeales archaeon]